MATGKDKILLVDDDASIRRIFSNELKQMGFVLETAADIPTAKSKLIEFEPDIAILDVKLPGGDGRNLLQYIYKNKPDTLCIMLTGHGDVEMAVECIRQGAYDFLTKPCSLDQLEFSIRRALEHHRLLEQRNTMTKGYRPVRTNEEIIGQTEPMQKLRSLIERIAPTDEPVLILGESGTGKELIAQALWRQSPRHDKPFIAINCGAVAENLLESELFGHEKGAFSGAEQRRIGLFELASEGVIFLDEIGDMPITMQAKLLRVLQSGEIRRVGGTETFHVNVRTVAATNHDLVQAVKDGYFREDLYHRINTFTIQSPQLRERVEDIEPLAQQILEQVAVSPGGRSVTISSEAMQQMKTYSWPGNVRELQNVIKRAAILCTGEEIRSIDLNDKISQINESTRTENGEPITLHNLEKKHILASLNEMGGNKSKVARTLGITTKTLYNKLDNYRQEQE